MAQSITGTNLAANWAAASQVLSRKVEIKWDGANWTDETTYVAACSARVGVSSNGVNGLPMLGGGSPSSGSLTLANDTGRFSQRNTGGALYSYIQYGFRRIAVRISAGYVDATNGAERVTVFTGYLYNGRESEGSGSMPMVSLELRGNEDLILQYKQSTLLYQNYTIDQFAAVLLTAAGVSLTALDKCLLPIPYAWLDDENTWEQLQQLAQAEVCFLWFGETGYCNLRRLSSLVERADSSTSQMTLTRGSAWYLESAQVAMNAYTQAVVEVASRGEGAAEVVYTSPEPIEVPAGGTKEVTAQFRAGLWRIIDPVKNTDWYAVTPGVQDISGDVSFTKTAYCQRAVFTFANVNAYQPAFVYGFQVRGYPLVGEEAEDIKATADATTLTTYWRGANAAQKELPIRGNPYIQTNQQAQLVANLSINWLKIPRTLITWEGPGAPWLQILDRVHPADAASGIDEDCWILDKQESLSANQYKQRLLLLPCANLFPHSDYFIVGSSSYKDSSSGKAFF